MRIRVNSKKFIFKAISIERLSRRFFIKTLVHAKSDQVSKMIWVS